MAGKKVQEARKEIVALLRDPASAAAAPTGAAGATSGAGAPSGAAPLRAEPRPVTHSVNFYEKGEHPLEFITTRQWFVRLLDKKDALMEMGNRISWHPDHMRLRYLNWTENLQFDWCISRQRFFGVAFPVWYPLDASSPPRLPDFTRPMLADPARLPVDPLSDAPCGYREEQRGKPNGFMGEPDVFDTWFTSSLSPQRASLWTLHPARHRKLFPMDVRPQAHDIIRTWAFYTIAKALLHDNAIPWRHVLLSGWILDPDRKKMSKSKGNVVTPMEYLEKYTAGGGRSWAGNARLGADTAFDENVLTAGKRLVAKVYNAGKFVLSQTAEVHPIDAELDRAFAARLNGCVARATASMEEFNFARALSETESFFWGSFTDSCIELAKNRAKGMEGVDAAGRGSAVAGLRLGLSVLLRLLAPFLPYVTEEVWSWVFAAEGGAGGGADAAGAGAPSAPGMRSIHTAAWPSDADFAGIPAPADERSFDVAAACLAAIHGFKTRSQSSVGTAVQGIVIGANAATLAAVGPCMGDVMAAARACGHALEERPEIGDMEFTVRAG